MASFYRTIGAIGALVGVNIAVRLLNIPIESNFVFGNHIGEAVMVVGLLALLTDLNIIKTKNGYLFLGLIALVFGAIWEVLSFSTLFIETGRQVVIAEWLKIGPIIIFLIGVPVLYISDRISRERIIWGFVSSGRQGLMINFIFCLGYATLALYLLIKWGWLVI